MGFTHVNQKGEAHMVDVSAKPATCREAKAQGYVQMQPNTLAMILAGEHHKGDVFAAARIAGIQAAKQCWQLIPLCHPLMLSQVEVSFDTDTQLSRVLIQARCKLTGSDGSGDGGIDCRIGCRTDHL